MTAEPHKMGLGYVPDPADERDYAWRSTVLQTPILLPKKFNRTKLGPVLNQGQTPECVCFSSTSLKMHQEAVEHGRFYNFQPHELYKLCKQRDGIPNQDGTYLRVALQIMQERGIFAKKGKGGLPEDYFFKVGDYIRLKSIREIKEALYTLGPVVFGITVDNGIFNPDSNGVIPPPNDDVVGGHAMTIVGWDDTKKNGQGVVTPSFKIKNSWGTEYGHRGYVWLPYTHFDHYTGWDAWRVVNVTDVLA